MKAYVLAYSGVLRAYATMNDAIRLYKREFDGKKMEVLSVECVIELGPEEPKSLLEVAEEIDATRDEPDPSTA